MNISHFALRAAARHALLARRRHAQRAAGRRPGREQIARVEVVHARELGQRLRRPVDQVRGDVVLPDLTVDREGELQA